MDTDGNFLCVLELSTNKTDVNEKLNPMNSLVYIKSVI